MYSFFIYFYWNKIQTIIIYVLLCTLIRLLCFIHILGVHRSNYVYYLKCYLVNNMYIFYSMMWIHSFFPSFIHSFIISFLDVCIISFFYSFNCLFVLSSIFVNSIEFSFFMLLPFWIRSATYLFTQLFIHSFVRSFV